MLHTTLPTHETRGRLIRIEELDETILSTWRNLASAHETYDSALLQPEFTQIVATVRQDVRIAIFESGDEILGILPLHLRPGGFARPIGAPFDDYSGPVLSPRLDCDLGTLLRLAGLAAYQAPGAVDPWNTLRPGSTAPRKDDEDAGEHHVIRPGSKSPADYLEQQRAANAKRFKNFRRLQNRAEREIGELELRWGRPDPRALERLFDFKSQQFRNSGLVNLIETRDARRVLDAVAQSEHGFLVSLWIADKLVSGHFGLRVGSSFHPWIAAFDPDYSDYSAGNLLIMQVLMQMPTMGLKTYDLAQGHDHYKKYFCNAARASFPVFAASQSRIGRRHQRSRALWTRLGADRGSGFIGRLRRRMDQIAVSDLRAVPRTREFFYAILARTVLGKTR